jgi:NHLM bacteriocin system ABC transporter ATP-binding protein
MNAALAAALRDAGAVRTVDGREPLALDDPALALWVEAGQLDVFAVPGRGPLGPGAREHLYRVGAGGLVLGLAREAAGRGWTLLAVPTAGTCVRAVGAADLAGLARRPGLAAAVAALVAGWVAAVVHGMRKPIQPRQYLTVQPGRQQQVAPGQAFFPVEPLVFVQLLEGLAEPFSQAALAVGTTGELLPLPASGWLQAGAPGCRIQSCSPPEALAQAAAWQGLQTFHAVAAAMSILEFERLEALEAERMRVKARHAAEYLQRGLQAFTRTLRGDAEAAFEALDADPLLAACQAIGQRIGVRFVPPPRAGLERADPVEEIAAAAGVRFRQVALRGNWWRTDASHLLGRWQESKRPVALIREGQGYLLHDPGDDRVLPVDEAVAGELVPFAHAFYRALPARALRAGDLVRFCLQGSRQDLARLFTLGLAIGVLGLFTPIISGYVFDTLIPSADRNQAMQVLGALVAVALAGGMFALARSLALLRLESRMDAGLQAALWDRALNLPIPFFRRYSAGELALRINAINQIRQALSGSTLTTVLTSVFALLNLALLFFYSARLALLALALVALAAVLNLGIGLAKLRYERHVSAANATLAGLVLEYLRGVAKLRVTGAESRAFANWARQFARLRRLSFASGNVQNVSDVFLSLYQVLADLALFGAAAWLLLQAGASGAAAPAAPALTTGQFIAFYGAFGQVVGAVAGLSTALLSVLHLVPLYEQVRPVLAAEPETGGGKTHPGELQGRVEVSRLSFRYAAEGPPVLDDVSFSAPPGSFVAVVGPSGSGKSTLLRCLLGFEKPAAGGVFYDNQNLAELDARTVRRQMGVVLQHSQVMPGSVFANIVGTTLLGIEDAWEAARFCGLEDDIRAMPMGMHTVISEGGNTLSGGQRQRILIARAIVQRPRILLFDEATSALDNPTQEVVTRSLAELRATRIVIAHRLSTIVGADRILVLDQGRIVQAGRYEELMAQPGLFRELAQRQLA